MTYRPSFTSFLGSALYGLSPAAIAGIVAYLAWESAGRWLWVLAGAAGLLSLFLVIQAAMVHRQHLWIDSTGIAVQGPLAPSALLWAEVARAVLRERINVCSRTDRLLVIEGAGRMVVFNVSTLSPHDEQEVIATVREHTRLAVQRDKASL